MGNSSISISVNLTEFSCGECGGVYAINERYRLQRYEKGGFWHCPYCQCSWGYCESEVDRQKKELEKERQRRKWAEDAEAKRRTQIANLQKQLSAQKGVNTRMKNRAAAGVCPCCNRTFKQLAAHMKNKHPDFVDSASGD